MKNWKLLSIIFVLIIFVLAACGGTDESEETTDESGNGDATEEQTSEESTESDAQYPMTVSPTVTSSESNDGSEEYTFEEVTLESMPERIVVFDYGFLDTLDALGVEGIVGVAKTLHYQITWKIIHRMNTQILEH